MNNYLAWMLLPPGGLITLGLLGLLLWRRRLGWLLVGLSLGLAWAMSTPKLAYPLIDAMQWRPALDAHGARRGGAQAIVILAGGKESDTPDSGDTVSRWTLARLRYGVDLYRLTGLPVVVSGGLANTSSPAESVLMSQTLERYFATPVLLAEPFSRNTYENARYSRQMLEPLGIRRILLVTQALHMTRAEEAFRRQGFEVIPAPTDYIGPDPSRAAWFPRAWMFNASCAALHELAGRAWYRLRYYSGVMDPPST